MSTIGKVFVILNLVLAAAFVGWASNVLNSNQEFRMKFESEKSAHVTTKSGLEKERDEQRAQKNAAETEKNRLNSELAGVKNERDSAKEQIKTLEAQTSTLNAAVTKINETLSGIESARDRLQGEKEAAVAARAAAEATKTEAVAKMDAAEMKAGTLEKQLGDANNAIADLEKAKTSVEKERDGLNTSIATLVANTGANLSDFQNVPDIDAGVLMVSMDVAPGLVSLNKGSKDGVKRGYVFELFDGKIYKGQARVEFVHDSMCSALIVRPVSGQRVQQGDSASTSL